MVIRPINPIFHPPYFDKSQIPPRHPSHLNLPTHFKLQSAISSTITKPTLSPLLAIKSKILFSFVIRDFPLIFEIYSMKTDLYDLIVQRSLNRVIPFFHLIPVLHNSDFMFRTFLVAAPAFVRFPSTFLKSILASNR